LDNDGVVVDEEATLRIPLLHLFFKNLVRLSVNKVFHDILPLSQIQHVALEEVLIIEELYNFFSVRLDEARVDGMGFLNN